MCLKKILKIKNLIFFNKLLMTKSSLYKNRYVCTGEDNVRISKLAQISNDALNRNAIKLGSGVSIDGILQVFYGEGHITIGDMSYVGPNSRIWSSVDIRIGSHCLISHNCNIIDSNSHPIDAQLRRLDYENIYNGGKGLSDKVSCKPIELGDDVWIGANSCIMKGVTLGDRTIVAAGSVVTKSFPSDVIVAGNPAKIVKVLDKEKMNV